MRVEFDQSSINDQKKKNLQATSSLMVQDVDTTRYYCGGCWQNPSPVYNLKKLDKS